MSPPEATVHVCYSQPCNNSRRVLFKAAAYLPESLEFFSFEATAGFQTSQTVSPRRSWIRSLGVETSALLRAGNLVDILPCNSEHGPVIL